MNLAFYGKGGIGKSTIASNISINFSLRGKSVMQIGCDPKHDSTLLLLEDNQEPVTVIQSMEQEIPEDRIILTGKHGVKCVEIGGPQPGLGCAGRGIIAGLGMLEQMDGFAGQNYDCVVYDILGDVVCGGFFEPLKKKKVDQMYIVTSGEFNSLFAANNLCRGYCNCRLKERGVVLAGIIANCRGIPKEEQIVKSFCDAVGVPLVALLPRDNRIEACTISCTPIADCYPDSDLMKILDQICDYIESVRHPLEYPRPMTLDELRGLFKKVVSERDE